MNIERFSICRGETIPSKDDYSIFLLISNLQHIKTSQSINPNQSNSYKKRYFIFKASVKFKKVMYARGQVHDSQGHHRDHKKGDPVYQIKRSYIIFFFYIRHHGEIENLEINGKNIQDQPASLEKAYSQKERSILQNLNWYTGAGHTDSYHHTVLKISPHRILNI